MKRLVQVVLLVVCAVLPISAGKVSDTLNVQALLSEPGVKLLVVEFYATSCKPCMKAVPEWKKLHDKYASKGLRFVVVSADENKCDKPPNWSPDKSFCDIEGDIQKMFNVNDLPTSFLFSWDGKIALRTHEVEPIENAIIRYFKETHLRMDVPKVDVIGDKYAVSSNPKWLRDYVIGEVLKQSKFDVVKGFEDETEVSVSGFCQTNVSVPANSKLQITVQGDDDGNRNLTVALKKDDCILAKESEPYKGTGLKEDFDSMKKAASKAVSRLIYDIVGKQSKNGMDNIQKDINAGGEYVSVQFISDPKGMKVYYKGAKICDATPCTAEVQSGRGIFEFTSPDGKYEKEELPSEIKKGIKPISVNMKPTFGRITIFSNPDNTNILLDGKLIGQTPIVEFETAEGDHKIEVSDSRYYPEPKTFNISRGNSKNFSLSLLPRQGTIIVDSKNDRGDKLSGAVFINDVEKGVTGQAILVNIGEVNVKVRTKQGESNKIIIVKEKQTETIIIKISDIGVVWLFSKPANVYFSKSEITVDQYAKCVKAGVCKEMNFEQNKDENKCNYGWWRHGEHPMNCVDWFGADTFCKWAGGRLPTDKEWYAEASAGGTRKYPWGESDVSCQFAVIDQGGIGCNEKSTWPVCSKEAGNSVNGLCDMAGNVWEWTSSPDTSNYKNHMIKGGSWVEDGKEKFKASNALFEAAISKNYIGFRCAQ